MKAPTLLMLAATSLSSRVSLRDPDLIIGEDKSPAYLRRWYVWPRNRFCNLYLHLFMASDDDRALHDHPWWSVSLLVSGSYTEHTRIPGQRRRIFKKGDLVFRRAKFAHRIELHDGGVWTLFLTGPRLRQWGFICPQGWRHWSVFTDKTGTAIGRGCD